MKTQSIRRERGFTLIELLVVISIIAVLAAAGFAAGNAAIQKAKRVTALSSATALESAVNNFNTEYGAMPSDSDSDVTLDTKTNEESILDVLLGTDDGEDLNPRGIKFLSAREGKGKRGGLVYRGRDSIDGLYDPWGGGFFVMIDCDFDEVVNPSVSGTSAELHRRVAVWSLGADGVDGGGKGKDDVKTWK